MEIMRPDLTGVPTNVLEYIQALEAQIAEQEKGSDNTKRRAETILEPSEPPTTIQVISLSKRGYAKRTPRHLYVRQRRSGMGVFDLECPDDESPTHLIIAELEDSLIVVTTEARAFRLPVSKIVETEVRGRGESILGDFPLKDGENLALAFAANGGASHGIDGSYVVLVSQRGQVRRIASHYLGEGLQPGTVLYNIAEGGPPAAACWSTGGQDLFLVTKAGQAIRFAEKQVPVRGCLGMRVSPTDEIVGVAAASADGGVLMVTEDGKGTIRLMAGFSANKSPGAGGKVGIKSDVVIGASAVGPNDDIFIISRLGKIIRFQANEIPAKEGVVQGVSCMSLRADECTALTTTVL
ncbi:MAG: DNA gyrase C-terminal beta-propeller domain-containing protein [Chloroflexota bacterium]